MRKKLLIIYSKTEKSIKETFEKYVEIAIKKCSGKSSYFKFYESYEKLVN